MSSNNEGDPDGASPCDGLRRSKRLSRSDNQSACSKILRISDDRPLKKLARKKLTKATKQTSKETREEKRQPSCSFSDEPLTQAELHQLFIKFTKDGHFHVNSMRSSPPPLVISRTSDGKVLTTKIETCRENKKFRFPVLTSQRTNMEEKMDANERTMVEPLFVTFSNPLPSATGSTMHLATSSDQRSPPSRANIHSASITRENRDNPSNFHKHYLTMSNIPSADMLGVPSDWATSNCTNSAKQQSFLSSTNVVYNSHEQFDATKNLHEANSSTFYCPSSNSHVDYSIDATNYETHHEDIAHNDLRGILNHANLQLMQSQYNAFENFNVTENSQAPYQIEQYNVANSSFPVENQSCYETSPNIWSPVCQIGFNSFVADSLTLSNNAISALPGNIGDCRSTNGPRYNSTVKNLSNNSPYERSGIDNSTIIDNSDQTSLYPPSFTSWNGLEPCSNSHVTGSNEAYQNCAYNLKNSMTRCDETSTIVHGQGNLVNSINSYHPNYSESKGLISITNRPKTNIQSVYDPNNFINVPATVTATMTNGSTDRVIMNGNKVNFGPEDFLYGQDDHYCPTVSTICSYDNDIVYENYVNPKNFRIDNNSVSTMSQYNDPNTNILPKMKTEVRPLCNAVNNYTQCNGYARSNGRDSIFYDFDAKKEFSNPTDCVIIE